ncbi:hypothetical protein FKP32DRAFT_1601069 [Trametes sanguinea]|nr:hypothetical protein FKP32DRAFT_1601069 [Trametes sanguinea]
MNDHYPTRMHSLTGSKPSLEFNTAVPSHLVMENNLDYNNSPTSPSPATALSAVPHRLCTPEISRSSSLSFATPLADPTQPVHGFSMISDPAAMHTIRNASHDILLNNELYRYTFMKNNELTQVIVDLNRTIGQLQGKYDEQKGIHSALLKKLSSATNSSGSSSISLNDNPWDEHPQTPAAEDHPLCRFWTRDQWTPYMQGGDRYEQRSVDSVLQYLEDADGQVVSKYRVAEIAEHQRRLWEKYRSEGRLPLKWSQADSDVVAHHRRNMYSKFPELALCDGDWKVTRFATERFSSWVRKYRPSGDEAMPDAEAADPNDNEDVADMGHTVRIPKRLRSDGLAHAGPRKVKRSKSQSVAAQPEPAEDRAPSPTSDFEDGPPAVHLSMSPPSPSAPSPLVKNTSESILNNAERRKSLLAKLARLEDGGNIDHRATPIFPTDGDLAISIETPGAESSKDSEPTAPINFMPALPSPSAVVIPIVGPSQAAPASSSNSQASIAHTHLPQAGHTSNVDASTPAGPSGQKTSKLRVLKNSFTARNLAAAAFLKVNANATTQDFTAFMNALTAEELLIHETRHRFALAYTAKDAGATIDVLLLAFENATEDELQVFRDAAAAHSAKAKKSRSAKGKEKAL